MKNIEGNNAKLTWKNMFQFVVELPIVTDNVIDAE